MYYKVFGLVGVRLRGGMDYLYWKFVKFQSSLLLRLPQAWQWKIMSALWCLLILLEGNYNHHLYYNLDSLHVEVPKFLTEMVKISKQFKIGSISGFRYQA